MYEIYKNGNSFGVGYDDIRIAIYVADIFEKTLGCKFTVKYNGIDTRFSWF